ncbi:unnamed protein product [Ceutorhynchus assimilis]|uniref:Cytochrome P450 n=1 Tax=Ceutorhynchus assimilis TaxID=467358 RepID=A0A9N9MXZ3_9CUCU|nr:unnamed protein product [Ceutorhynchus assimilis]
MIISLYLIGFCTCVFYLHFVYRNWRYLKFSWQVKNGFWYPILPLIGNTYVTLFSDSLNVTSLAQWIDKIKGFPFSLWYGNKYTYITRDAKEIKIIVNHPKCINKSLMYDKFKFFFEHSIFSVPDETWKKQRKHFVTGFKSSILKNNIYVYYNHSNQMIEDLKSVKIPKDIFWYFARYAIQSFFLGNTGISDYLPSFEIDTVGDNIFRIHDLLNSLIALPFISPKLWLAIFPAGKKVTKLLQKSEDIIKNGLEHKRKMLKEKQEYFENTKDFFELCLTYGADDLDDRKRIQQVDLFASAASDTTGNALAFTFILLGMHQEIQAKLYEEVMEVVGDKDITHQDLPNLKYTEAVICETMRLFPSVPLIGRLCNEDINLGTKILPKGSSCMFSILHLHRDPQYWPDPLKFDPSRFLPENQSKINPSSFMAFSAGPRDCLGKTQALAMMKVTVANVVRYFKITSKHKCFEEFTLESCLTMKTKESPNCRFSARKKL